MFVEIAAFALMAFIATSEGTGVWNGLSAKWTLDGKDGFYPLPDNLQDARRKGWIEISGIDGPSNEIGLGYHGDARIILIFLKRCGKVIGLQVGFRVEDVKNAEGSINYKDNPAITKKTLGGVEYFTATAKFSKDKWTGTRQLWFHENGKFHPVPTKAHLVTSETSYYLKRCVPGMGLHYFKINSTTDCSNLYPWFLLRVKDDIIGFGFQGIGTSSSAPQRTWFETFSLKGVIHTTPDAPACIRKGVEAYGLLSFHVWFKKDPRSITCIDECTATISSADGDGQQGYTGGRQKRALGDANVCPV